MGDKTYYIWSRGYEAVEACVEESTEETLLDANEVHRLVRTKWAQNKLDRKDFNVALEGLVYQPPFFNLRNVARENKGRVMLNLLYAVAQCGHLFPLLCKRLLILFLEEVMDGDMLKPDAREVLMNFVNYLASRCDLAVPLTLQYGAISTLIFASDESCVPQCVDLLRILQTSLRFDINAPLKNMQPPLALCILDDRGTSDMCRQLVVRLGADVNAHYSMEYRSHAFHAWTASQEGIFYSALGLLAVAGRNDVYADDNEERYMNAWSKMMALAAAGMRATAFEMPKLREQMKHSIDVVYLVRMHPEWGVPYPEDTTGEYVLNDELILRERSPEEQLIVRVHVALGMPDEGADSLVEVPRDVAALLSRDYTHASMTQNTMRTKVEMAFLIKDLEWLRELVSQMGEKAVLAKLFQDNDMAIQVAARIFPVAIPLQEREALTQTALEFAAYLRSGEYELTPKTFAWRTADVRERVRQSLLAQQRMAQTADGEAMTRLPTEMWDLMRSYM